MVRNLCCHFIMNRIYLVRNIERSNMIYAITAEEVNEAISA